MSDVKTYFTLLRTCMKNSFDVFNGRFFGKRDKESKNVDFDETAGKNNGKTKAKKFFGVLLMALLCAFILFYVVVTASQLSRYFISNGMIKECIYAFCTVTQIVVLFIGSISTLNYMYFGKDNRTLMSLPIKSSVIFAVKLSLAYLSQLLICAIMYLPLLITFGVVFRSVTAASLGAGYYIIGVISTFLIPIIPILAISIISIPLMYFVSFFKNREAGKAIVSSVLSLVVAAIYLTFVFGAYSGDAGKTDGNVVAIFAGVSKMGIYNYNLVTALCGEKAALNFFLYILEIIGALALGILVSAAFYRKGLYVTVEGNGRSFSKKHSKKTANYAKTSFFKTFIKKEIKCLFGNTQLFIGLIIGVVVVPVFCVIMSKSGNFDFTEEGKAVTMGTELFLVGFVSYFVSIFLCSSNMYSLAGFSIEGQNICLLKSMPIRPKDVLTAKVLAANIGTAIISIVGAISYVAVSKFHNPLVGLCLLVVFLLNGIASSFIGLYNDIKKPVFKFDNINELTNNNKKMIKPMLIDLSVSFIYLIIGIVFASISGGKLSDTVLYIIFFAVSIVVNGLFAFVTGKKLYDNIDEYFERAEA